jgi:tetratricopeptide (TPR) repeat protein
MVSMAMLAGVQGRFDEARQTLAEIRGFLPAPALTSYESVLLSYGARLELLGGNFQRAEELARALCTDYRAAGLRAFLSSEQMFLVDALLGQGRIEEAAAELDQAPAGAADDTDAQFRQARSRAMLELARGNLRAAEDLARTAVGFMEETQSAEEHCQTLFVLAHVLSAADLEDEAHEVVSQALRIAEDRENVVFAQRAREMLGAAEPAGTSVRA